MPVRSILVSPIISSDMDPINSTAEISVLRATPYKQRIPTTNSITELSDKSFSSLCCDASSEAHYTESPRIAEPEMKNVKASDLQLSFLNLPTSVDAPKVSPRTPSPRAVQFQAPPREEVDPSTPITPNKFRSLRLKQSDEKAIPEQRLSQRELLSPESSSESTVFVVLRSPLKHPVSPKCCPEIPSLIESEGHNPVEYGSSPRILTDRKSKIVSARGSTNSSPLHPSNGSPKMLPTTSSFPPALSSPPPRFRGLASFSATEL